MRQRVAVLLIFVASLALYLPAMSNDFAYDDHVVISMNDQVHDLSSAGQLFTQPYWPIEDLGLYRPLASITYAVDWTLSGGDPAWFHFVNALWNAVACAVVFLFLLAFVPAGVAMLGALLFAAHPVHVEAVANVVGRAEVMAAAFAVAAMLVWVRADADRPLPPARLALVLLFYVLALLSKESAIMLPALIVLADTARGIFTPANLRAWSRRHAVALAAMGAAAFAFLAVRTAVLGELGPDAVDPVLDVATSTSARIMTALQAWPIILRLLVFPWTLLADYGPAIIMPALSVTAEAAAGAVIFAALVLGGAAAWLKGRGRTAAVLLFLPVALLPTSNLLVPIGIIVAERTLYLPSLALAMGVAFAAQVVWNGRPHRHAVTAAAMVVVLLFSVRTVIRIPVWSSTRSVHDALLRDRPDSYRAVWYFARVAVSRDEPRLALEKYGEALAIWPFRERMVLEAAGYAARVGDLPFAGKVTTFAVSRWPNDVDFLRMHAGVQLDLGDFANALTTLDRALQVAPSDSTLLAMRTAALDGLQP